VSYACSPNAIGSVSAREVACRPFGTGRRARRRAAYVPRSRVRGVRVVIESSGGAQVLASSTGTDVNQSALGHRRLGDRAGGQHLGSELVPRGHVAAPS